MEQIHFSAPLFASESGNVRVDKSFGQKACFNLRNQVCGGECLPFDVTYCASFWDNSFKSESDSIVTGAATDDGKYSHIF